MVTSSNLPTEYSFLIISPSSFMLSCKESHPQALIDYLKLVGEF
jgi:hypothetical protein